LHLLLRGGEFLVGGLQFFIGGLQFLVGGPEFLLRGLHLFVGGPRLAANLQKFLLQFRQPRAAGVSFGGRPAALAAAGAAHVGENNHHQPLQRPGFIKSLDGHIHALLPPLVPTLSPCSVTLLFAGALP
jgi:hypothetical protein